MWDYRERETHDNEQNCIRYEIRKCHQPNAAEQRNETLLPLPENKIRQTDRAKNSSKINAPSLLTEDRLSTRNFS